MASNKKKSEGPFLVISSSSISISSSAKEKGTPPIDLVSDGASHYSTFFKTRAALEAFLKTQDTSRYIYYVFDALSSVSFEHVMVTGAINAHA